MRNQKKLLIEQLDRKIEPFKEAAKIDVPRKGWVNTVRKTLNMTLLQLGKRLDMTSQGVRDMEEREASGSISLKSLKEAGNALEMQFVYGFVPLKGSFDNMINLKARKLAEKIILRTNQNMKLEDQGNSDKYIKNAIDELTIEIKRELKRSIWD